MNQSDIFLTELNALIAVTHKILDEASIKHWIDFGTLLSAVRDQTLIPWDSDADMGYLYTDKARILALDSQFRSEGHQVDQILDIYLKIRPISKETPYVDLYAWEEQNGIMIPHSIDWPNFNFSLQFIEPLATISLHGNAYPCPNPAKQFLVMHRYGPDYRIPVRYPKAFSSNRIHQLIPPIYLTTEINSLLNKLSDQEDKIAELSLSKSHDAASPPLTELSLDERHNAPLVPTAPPTTLFYQIYLKCTPLRWLYRRIYRSFHRSNFYHERLYNPHSDDTILYDLMHLFNPEKPAHIQPKKLHYMLLRQQKRYQKIIKKHNRR